MSLTARADVSQAAAPGESSSLASTSASSSLTTSSDASSSSTSTETAATSATISVSSSSEVSTSSSSSDATSTSDALSTEVASSSSSSPVDAVLSSSSLDPTLLATSSAASLTSALSSSESLASTTSAASLTSQSSSSAVLTLTSSSSELTSSSSVTLSSSTISSSVSISASEPATFSTTSSATIFSNAESSVSSSTSISVSTSNEISTSDPATVEVSLTSNTSLTSSATSVTSAATALSSSSIDASSTVADVSSSSAVPNSIGPSSSSAAIAPSTESVSPTPASTPTPTSAAAAAPRTEDQSDPVATPTIPSTAASPTSTSSSSSSSSDTTDSSNSSDLSSDGNEVTSSVPATVAASQPTIATGGNSGSTDDSASASTSVTLSDVATSTVSSDVDSTSTSAAGDDITSATTAATNPELTTAEFSDTSSDPDGSITSDATDISASTFASSDPEATATASNDVSASLTLSESLTQASPAFDSTVLSTTDIATETALATATSTDDDGDLAGRITSLTGFFSTFTPGEGKAASTQAPILSFPQRIANSETPSPDQSSTTTAETQPTPVQDTAPSSTADDSGDGSAATPPVNVGGSVTLSSTLTGGTSTRSLSPSSTVSGTNSGIPLGDAAKQAMSPATIAGIVISIVGSFALILVVAFFLLRRRRERARVRALAHESFGPGIPPRSGSSQSRHAPSPSHVAFLGIGRSRSQGSNYDDDADDGENRGLGAFFARARGALVPRKENVLREKGIEHIREKPAEVYEQGLNDGDGSFLPPLAPVRALSPLPPFGGVSSNAEATGNVNASANPFLDAPTSNSVTPVEIGRARAPSTVLVPAANAVPIAVPPAIPNDTAPRPDDPFWDPEDLLPPALRLSALKKQTAAWKASPANSTGSQSGSGPSSIMTNASVVVPPGLNKMERTSNTSSFIPGLVPHDPFADPGMQPDLDLRDQAASSVEGEDKPMVMPDIFDYRASTTSSDVGPAGGEREGYTSWLSQPGWARSVRSSMSTSSSASVPRQAEVVPPLPAGSTRAYSYSSDGRLSMSGSSVLASSVGSGVGINVDAASNSSLKVAPAAGIALGMLRSQSPERKYDFAFFRDNADGASDVGQRLSYLSGESHETGRYQMYGNAL
ncbi:hypothetical protein ACEPAG_7521 [Sanghuangporus baumii]